MPSHAGARVVLISCSTVVADAHQLVKRRPYVGVSSRLPIMGPIRPVVCFRAGVVTLSLDLPGDVPDVRGDFFIQLG